MTTDARSPDRIRVLVVEDEVDVRNLITLHLKREGHEVVEAGDGESALDRLAEGGIDLAVLDWMLPGLSGFDVCRAVQRKVPVLMVTARADAHDIVSALEVGADDYITKPFQVSVFLARVRALLRRSRPQTLPAPTRFEVGRLVLDSESYSSRCEGEELKLTASEFKALHALLQHEGRILSRTKLMSLVQGEGVKVTERAIDTLIFGLRKNMGPCAALIETVRGVGYRLKAPN